MAYPDPQSKPATNGHPPRPVALAVVAENIPAELKVLPQWVLWRYEQRRDKGGKAEWTKPLFGVGGGPASSTDPSTWAPFEFVLDVYERGGWDGVGLIVLPENNLTGIDLDKCRAGDGAVEPWAAAVVARMNTYAEVSPSGHGLRVFCRGRKPDRERSRRGRVEIYDGLTADGSPGGRYLTLTGHRLADVPAEVLDRQGELASVYEELVKGKKAGGPGRHAGKPGGKWSPPDGPLSDDDILRLIESGRDKKLTDLWGGYTAGHEGDDSRADSALLVKLAYYVGSLDEPRLERLFRASGLYRDKWERESYRRLTFDFLKTLNVTFRERRAGPSAKGPDKAGEGWEVIRDYFRRRYGDGFRQGEAVFSNAEQRHVTRQEACAALPPDLIAPLGKATNAPAFKNGTANPDALPGFFKKWAGTAWLAYLRELPDEDGAQEGAVELAAEEFRRLVRQALLSEFTIARKIRDERTHESEVRHEHRSAIGWCEAFAKPGSWRAVRSKQLWCREVITEHGEAVLKVAVRHELFGQLRADRRLIEIGPSRFIRRATRYGVGKPGGQQDRPGGRWAFVLCDDFVADLIATLPDD